HRNSPWSPGPKDLTRYQRQQPDFSAFPQTVHAAAHGSINVKFTLIPVNCGKVLMGFDMWESITASDVEQPKHTLNLRRAATLSPTARKIGEIDADVSRTTKSCCRSPPACFIAPQKKFAEQSYTIRG